MRNSTLFALVAASALTASAAAPQLSGLAIKPLHGQHAAAGLDAKSKAKLPVDLKSMTKLQSAPRSSQKGAATRAMLREPGAPSPDLTIVTEAPEGVSTRYVRTGTTLAFSMFGVIWQESDGTLNNMVVTEDYKVYMDKMFSLVDMDALLVGDVEDGKYTFTFPQYIEHQEYNYGTDEDPDIEITDYYAMVLYYEEDEDGEGWFYVADDQSYTLTVGEDGTLKADDPSLMIGACAWVTEAEDPENGPYWAWGILGDTYGTFTPFDKEVEPTPEEVVFEDWTFVNGINAFTAQVGFLGDKCYLRGFAQDYYEIADTPIVGTVKDGKVTFESGQFLGVIETYSSTAYFLGIEVEMLEDDWGPYLAPVGIADELVFDYSEENHLMTTDGAFCVSSAADKVLYYVMYNQPAVKKAVENPVIKTLKAPSDCIYYEEEPDYDFPQNVVFYLPMTDADYNLLDPEKYFWNFLVDGDEFVFASDEYVGLEEWFGPDYEMTDVPYGFNDGTDFWGWDNRQDFFIYVEGFETLAVRGVYKDGDNVIYSPISYIVGDPSAVKEVEAAEVVSSSYIDLQGRAIGNPAQGLYIRADKMADGTVRHTKVVRK